MVYKHNKVVSRWLTKLNYEEVEDLALSPAHIHEHTQHLDTHHTCPHLIDGTITFKKRIRSPHLLKNS